MEKISSLSQEHLLNIDLFIPLYFRDHYWSGKAVLPAVESMEILAQAVLSKFPDVNPFFITDSNFLKFLEIPPKADYLSVNIRLQVEHQGAIKASLYSLIQLKNSGIKRTIEHASLFFSALTPEQLSPVLEFSAAMPASAIKIPAAAVYAELVPFGPAYHNIQNKLLLAEHKAFAYIRAHVPHPAAYQLGSPFILDAAFHAACVWGQRYAGITGFPLSCKSIRIFNPPEFDELYYAQIIPLTISGLQFEADILIYDNQGICCQYAQQVLMRDISAGKEKPPDWIQIPVPSSFRLSPE